MKKRYIVFLCLLLAFGLSALGFELARRQVTASDTRDFAAETFRGDSETKYAQLALYPTEEDGLTAEGVMYIKNQIEEALTKESIRAKGNYLLCASTEQKTVVLREGKAVDATATVYFGNWFGLHPDLPVAGGYLPEDGSTIEYCVIDDLLAWRVFGSTDVCGMDLTVGDCIYTVNAVVPADRGTYADYYGVTPRMYVLYNSAAYRESDLRFTSLEVVLPDPITDFASDLFKEAVSNYGDDVCVITGRFGIPALWEIIKEFPERGVMNGKICPYYENIARIREAKAAILFAFEGAFALLCALSAFVLLGMLWRDVETRLRQRRIRRNTHAIPSSN